jgi:hypothetical protein
VIVKGFEKCCISNAMNGREDVQNVGSESGEVGNCGDSETNW